MYTAPIHPPLPYNSLSERLTHFLDTRLHCIQLIANHCSPEQDAFKQAEQQVLADEASYLHQ
ncbi:hypothetical protein [Acinetobacter sp. 10FS3-1]|uniref:hypothetical protein n=2 Tax=Moraxellaceae TaxID=468 RepID=UPI001E4FA8F8|nr:hypothetical protein [Acinetobacter sp. 10FS3-1]